MPRLTGPLFSLEAHGQLGHDLIYYQVGEKAYARTYSIPANPRTRRQQSGRIVWGFQYRMWYSLFDSGTRDEWNTAAIGSGLTGIQRLFKVNQLNWATDQPLRFHPYDVTTELSDPACFATLYESYIDFGYNYSTGSGLETVAIFMQPDTDDGLFDHRNLIALRYITDDSEFQLPRYSDGTYYFGVRYGGNKDTYESPDATCSLTIP